MIWLASDCGNALRPVDKTMASTVWLGLRNSQSGVEKNFEEDFTVLAKDLQLLGKICGEHDVRDINQFVDYSEVLGSVTDALPATIAAKPFQRIPIQEAIDTLSILIRNTEGALQTESRSLLEKCKTGVEK